MARHPKLERLRARAAARALATAFLCAGLIGAPPMGSASEPAAVTGPDIRINNPAQDRNDDPADGLRLPNCNTQSEVSLAALGDQLVAGWNDMGDQCLEAHLGVDGVSTIGVGTRKEGEEWKDQDPGLLPPTEGPITTLIGDPVLAADGEDTVYYAALGKIPGSGPRTGRRIVAVARSTNGGSTWLEPVDASAGRTGNADKPWMAVDATDSAHRGNIYLAWTEEIEDTGQRKIVFARSIDGGETYTTKELRAAAAGWGTELAVGPNGEVYVVFLLSNIEVRFTRSTDGGESFSPEIKVTGLNYLGDRIETCVPESIDMQVLNGQIRVHNFPSLAVDTSGSSDPEAADYNPRRGRLYIAIAHDLVVGGADQADIAFLTSSDGGETWTDTNNGAKPTRIINDVQQNDQWHPQVEVDDRGTIAVTWYDRRLSSDNTAIDVFGTISTDGGQTFSPNFRVTDRSFPPAVTDPNPGLMGSCYMGDYNGLVAIGEGRFVAAWGDNRNSLLELGDPPDARAELPDPDVYSDVITVPAAD